MSNIKFVILWTLPNLLKTSSTMILQMHYEDAEKFKDELWDMLNKFGNNPDSIIYEILSK